MANSATNLDLISSSQAQKEVTANALFDAASQTMVGGRRGSTTTALTWGYYGGNAILSGGSIFSIANGVLTLTALTTNYVEVNESTGAITVNTVGFSGAGYTQLYSIVTGASTVTSYTDYRTTLRFSSYTLPTATTSVLGGVKIDGTTITIASGVISAAQYTLPTATTSVLGGVKVDGTTITISSGVISSAGGSGLTNFTEGVNTASPNGSIPVVYFVANNAATDVDVALITKGNGALMAQIPTGTSSGGNKRGTKAVDWQMGRAAANQVASGVFSVIAGGNSNRAEAAFAGVLAGNNNTIDSSNSSVVVGGDTNLINIAGSSNGILAGSTNTISSVNYSVIGGGLSNDITCSSSGILAGENNTISSSSNQSGIIGGDSNIITNFATQAFIGAGQSNSNNGGSLGVICGGFTNLNVNGNRAFIGGGGSNETRANYSIVVGGLTNKSTAQHAICMNGTLNTADGTYSISMGRNTHTKGTYGIKVWSTGNFNAGTSDGKVQTEENQLRGETSASSSIVLTSNNTTASTDNQISFATNDIKTITGVATIQDSTTAAIYGTYSFVVAARNIAGIVTIQSNTVTTIYEDAAATAAGFSIVASVDAANLAVAFTASKTSGNDITAVLKYEALQLNK